MRPSRIQRFATLLERVPVALRPAAYGALTVIAITASRGGLIGIPLVLLLVLLTSSTPMEDIAFGLGVLGLAVLGGALSGLCYTAAKRWLSRIPFVGPYIAGVATFLPYGIIVTGIVRLLNGESLAVAVV